MHFRVQLISCGCCLLLASQMAVATAKGRKPAQRPSTPPPVQTAPPVPQPPPTPEQMPATPPHVTMSNGLLSITADNSTLGDVLSAVRRQTGAALELTSGASNERVAVRLGPASPRDVIQQLLAGSKYDYILVGSPTDPSALQRIILTTRAPGGAGMAVASNQPAPPPQSNYQPPPDVSEAEEDQAPEPAPPEPPQQPQGEQQPVTPPSGPQPYSNQPKTPEQLLQELQRMQQQQQQQQGPRGPGAQPPQ